MEVPHLPALLWLAAHIDGDESAAHIVLDGHGSVTSFQEHEEHDELSVGAVDVFLSRVAHCWHLAHVLELV